MGRRAYAADAVVFEEAPAPIILDVYDWSGAYIGIQGGYGWADIDMDFDAGIASFEDDTFDLDGGFAGVYAGYNFRLNNLVLGVEADINKAWLDESFELVPGEEDVEVEIDWFGSLRGRLGYSWDRTLVFGTAGVAYAKTEIDGLGFDDDEDFTGWTAGVGIEHAFTDKWLARAEYRYYDFGDGEFEDEQFFDTGLDLDMHTISVGIAYKF